MIFRLAEFFCLLEPSVREVKREKEHNTPQVDMSASAASKFILQGVISLEESNGVIKRVKASFALKANGERFEKVMEYNDFLKINGAAWAISLFKKRGNKPSKGSDEESEEEALKEKKKEKNTSSISARRSKRLSEKVSDKEETTNPTKNNQTPKLPVVMDKCDDHFDSNAVPGNTPKNNVLNSHSKPKDPVIKGVSNNTPQQTTHTPANSPPITQVSNAAPQPKDNATKPAPSNHDGDHTIPQGQEDLNLEDDVIEEGEIGSKRVNIVYSLLETDILEEITNEEYFALMEEYRLICKRDGDWVDKQLTRLGLEVPDTLGKELVERVELEGSTIPPTEVDLDRGINLKVDMILYNCKDTSNKHITAITKTKITDLDISGNNSAANIIFRVTGVFNGIRAIINVVRSGEGCDLHFRQAIDGFDKERTTFVGGVNGVIRNQDL